MNAYFPNSKWYNLFDGEMVNNYESNYVQLEAPLELINAHIRGGYIIPFQFPSMTTAASRKNPFGLYVALGQGSNVTYTSATGNLYWDDGESLDSVETSSFNLFEFSAIEDNIVSPKIHLIIM